MPEELKLLSCPACGAAAKTCTSGSFYTTVRCHSSECGLRGPMRNGSEEAIIAWNSLPRPLTWATSPPKVAGWYMYLGQKSNGLIILIKVTPEHLRTDKGMVEDFGMWAGPVTMPKDL